MTNEQQARCFIGLCKCGGIVFASVDEPQYAKDNAKEVGALIRRGFSVTTESVDVARKGRWCRSSKEHMSALEHVPKWLDRQRIGTLRRLEAELEQRLREVRSEIQMVVVKRESFVTAREELSLTADRTDHMIMLWAQRNPRVCASNAPTGEHINYGGRREP